MFERFTDRARRVLVLAQEEARGLNHNFIGTEHILLGILHDGDSPTAEIMASLGIRADAVRTAVAETVGPMSGLRVDSPPFTPRAKRVLELSLREALQHGQNFIGDGHLMLGLVREGEGVAVQVLAGLGADLSRIRQGIVTHIAEAPPTSGERQRVERIEGFERLEDLDEAHCPHCRARLQETARYQILEIPAAEGQPGDAIRVTVVYCNRCRSAVPIGPPPASPASPPAAD